jgi:hypothetical protein
VKPKGKEKTKAKKKFNHFAYLGIEEIRDDAVYLKDGTVYCVLNVKPIDMNKITPEKRLTIIAHYRNWLQSLTYPVQVIGRTINNDIKEQVNIFKTTTEHDIKEKQNYKNTLRSFREFSDWLTGYLDKNCNSNRLYYIIISHKPTFIKDKDIKKRIYYKKSLDIVKQRSEQTKELLENTGVKIKRLTNTDLENLYSSYFTMFLQLNKTKNSRYLPSKRWLDMWKMEVIQNGTS